MPTIKIEKSLELSNENIDDLLAAAFEGGINYWCKKVKALKLLKPEHDGLFLSQLLPLGYTLVLFDAESQDKWELTLEKFLKAVKWYCEEYGYINIDDLMNEHDATTADLIVQYALFNEIVFG
jgi:hypothetical protein